MYTFHIMCFFTFSHISKTLILCSIKQKPRTRSNKLTAHSMRNTDNEGIDLAFASTVINMIGGSFTYSSSLN